MLARFLAPGWGLLAVVGVVVPFLSSGLAGWRAYGWGVEREKARWILASKNAQDAHDEQVAALQIQIDTIAREHEAERFALAERLSRLQLKIGSSDEDFLVPADEPVFSDGLLSDLDAVGRD